MAKQNITSGCYINLVLKAQPTTSKISYIHTSNPTISIAHLSLPLHLDQVLPMAQTLPMGVLSQSILPPQVLHLVHVHNIPNLILKQFFFYLYNYSLPDGEPDGE